MKIFLSQQIKDWDTTTILTEPISSAMLMQRAAEKAYKEIEKIISKNNTIGVVCGVGNNGGDGLIIARLLSEHLYKVTLFVVGDLTLATEDFRHQFKKINIPITQISNTEDLFKLETKEIIIDAILGVGANREIGGFYKALIKKINSFNSYVVSIDVPSGLIIDKFEISKDCIHANLTLTFQGQKLPFFIEGVEKITGQVKVIDIGLNSKYYESKSTNFFYVDKNLISQFEIPRSSNATKKDFGHTLIIGALKGMAGATIFASMAAHKFGSGLTSILSKEDNRMIYQTTVPEIMCLDAEEFDFKKGIERYSAILIGPGLGTSDSALALVEKVLNCKVPLVIDADALNIISRQKIFHKIPKGSVITPHKMEFERMFPQVDFNDLEKIQEISTSSGVILILKGSHTRIFEPGGKIYFNSTGHPCLAKAGSGDVLAGMIAGGISRYGNNLTSCLLSTFLHGMSAQVYLEDNFEECLRPQDLVDNLPKAYRKIFMR